MRFLRWIAGFTIALTVAGFAVLNRAPVSIYWNPFSVPVDMPFYIPGLALLAAGFMLGALTVWLNTDPLHLEQRRQRKHIKNLENQLQTLHVEKQDAVPNDFFPTLPVKMRKR